MIDLDAGVPGFIEVVIGGKTFAVDLDDAASRIMEVYTLNPLATTPNHVICEHVRAVMTDVYGMPAVNNYLVNRFIEGVDKAAGELEKKDDGPAATIDSPGVSPDSTVSMLGDWDTEP